MPALFVKIGHPKGCVEERWKIKVLKDWTMPPDAIMAKKSHKAHAIKSLSVGRNVSNKDIREYFRDYLKSQGLWERVLSMRFKTT